MDHDGSKYFFLCALSLTIFQMCCQFLLALVSVIVN